MVERLEQEYALKLATAMEEVAKGYEAAKQAGEVRLTEAEAAHESVHKQWRVTCDSFCFL